MYMHRQEPSVIYRDLKPANIMLGPKNRVTLIDFGIARHFKPGQSKDTIPFGSPGYAAPEQYGKAQTTPRSDIYSLGALLHQMLTGQDPAEHPFAFPPIHITTPGLPLELGSFIARMLALSPEERPTSMVEVQYQLKQAYIGLKDRLSDKVENSVPVPALVSRRAMVGWGAFGLVGLAAIGITALFDKHMQPPVSIQSPSTQAPTATPVTYVTPDDTIPRTPELTKIKVVATQRVPNQEVAAAFVNGVDVPFNILASTNNNVHVLYVDHIVSYTGHIKPVKYISYTTGGTDVATCAENETVVHIWDCATGQATMRLHAPAPVVALCLWENMLAVACDDNTVYLYDLSNTSDATHPTPVRTYPTLMPITALIVQQPVDTNFYDHLYLGIGFQNGIVQVWADTDIVTQYEHSKAITALQCWDQLIVSSSLDQTVQVYQFTTNTSFALYLGHTHKVNTVTWLTYNTLASLDESGEVHIWTYPSGKIVLTEPLLTTRADPHYHMKTSVAKSHYYLSCLTSPTSITTYHIS
nr:WD40 repeat domain-containing serine/threonine protein kinase [Ktedonospora formicarum]